MNDIKNPQKTALGTPAPVRPQAVIPLRERSMSAPRSAPQQ